MKKNFSWGLWTVSLFVTLLALASSLYLTQSHFVLLKSGFGGQSFCNISSYINCDSVLSSSYAELGPIPLAGLGLVFYVYLLGALLYVAIDHESRQKVLGIPFLLIHFAVLLSFGLAYISLMKIQALCIFCSSLYLFNFLLLFLLKGVLGMKYSEFFSGLKNISWVKGLGYLFLVFVVGGILLVNKHEQYAQEIPQENLNRYLDNFFKQPVETFDVEGRPFIGNPQASIVVVEFSDFECPYCKKAAFTLKPLLKPYFDKVKLVFMQYPLDNQCNTAMQHALHQRACSAAYASYCAGKQDKFWDYHDKLFERQPKFQQESLENIAEKLQLDMDQFKACISDPATQEAIVQDIQQGSKSKVQGTPTIFVNGRVFRAWPFRKAWKQLIERIEKQPQPQTASKPSP